MEITGQPGDELLRVLEQLVAFLRRLTTNGLSTAAAAALRRLARDGAQRVTDLAKAERVSQPAMTQLVGRLERDGLVRRVSSPHDGREVLVELTDAGEDLLGRRRAQFAAAFTQLLDQQLPADRRAIAAALPALGRLAQAADAADHPTPAEAVR
jgi:DNA-binding MarR family transcriptional regulator